MITLCPVQVLKLTAPSHSGTEPALCRVGPLTEASSPSGDGLIHVLLSSPSSLLTVELGLACVLAQTLPALVSQWCSISPNTGVGSLSPTHWLEHLFNRKLMWAMHASHIGKSKKVGISWWSSGPHFHSRGHGWVQSLVGELGSCMPCGVTKRKKSKTKEKSPTTTKRKR